MHRRAAHRARFLRRALLPVVAACLAALPRVSGAVSGSDLLLWPTEAGICLTSTFGEFREGHFHSGMDVSTGGKVGFPVFAVADGEIARVRQSCRGYGKAIYLRMKDGRYAVYAHLSEFSAALAESVRAIQRRAGDSHFDHSFASGAIRVKRGERIGKTGQSGAGPPHLHFELRDAQERALDPLAHGIGAPDAKPPRITRVALTPLTPESSVEGDSRTVFVRVIPRKDGSFVAERTIAAWGKIGIALEAKDAIDACDRGMAPKRWELNEGTTTLFAVECDRFSFDEWGQSDLQFDSRWTYSGEGDFVNLWRRAGNEMPSSAGDWPAADGVEVPKAEGTWRTVQVAAIDAAGNRTAAELTLTPPAFDAEPDSAVAAPGAPNSLLDVVAVAETRGGWVEARFSRLPSGVKLEPVDAAPLRLTILPRRERDARIVFIPTSSSPTTLRVALVESAESRVVDVVLPGLTVRANEAGSVASEDSAVVIRFPRRSLRENTAAMIRGHAPIPYPDELRLVGDLHILDTGFVPLADEYQVAMRQPPDFAGDPDRLGVFVHVGDGFRYIGGGNGRGAFEGSTQRPRPFGLFEDRRPPAIGRPRLVRHADRWRVLLTVRDRGAGVDCEDVAVTLDGERLLTEYDGETGEVAAWLDRKPAPGVRTVRVTVSDRLGNRSERKETVKALAK